MKEIDEKDNWGQFTTNKELIVKVTGLCIIIGILIFVALKIIDLVIGS